MRDEIMSFTWARAIAFRHAFDAVSGDPQALKNAYLQIDGPVVDEPDAESSSGPLKIIFEDKRTVTPEMLDFDGDVADEQAE